MNYDEIKQVADPTQLLKEKLDTLLVNIQDFNKEKNHLSKRLNEVNYHLASLSVISQVIENELNKHLGEKR